MSDFPSKNFPTTLSNYPYSNQLEGYKPGNDNNNEKIQQAVEARIYFIDDEADDSYLIV